MPGPLSSICLHCSSLAGGRRNPAGRHPESSSHQRATQVAALVRRAQHVDLCAELRYPSDRAPDCFVRQFCFTTRGHPGVRSAEKQQQPRACSRSNSTGVSSSGRELGSLSFFGCPKVQACTCTLVPASCCGEFSSRNRSYSLHLPSPSSRMSVCRSGNSGEARYRNAGSHRRPSRTPTHRSGNRGTPTAGRFPETRCARRSPRSWPRAI